MFHMLILLYYLLYCYSLLQFEMRNVKFPVRLIGHFARNIIMAKTCSNAKVNSAKCHNFSNPPEYLSAKIFSETELYVYFWNYRLYVQS